LSDSRAHSKRGVVIVGTWPDTTEEQLEHLRAALALEGFTAHVSRGGDRSVLVAMGDVSPMNMAALMVLPGVESVTPVRKPYQLAARESSAGQTVVRVPSATGAVEVGGNDLAVIAGPCSVESEEMLLGTARAVGAAGAVMLRGGAFKPRTSPYSFQGLGEEGLEMLARVREETGMPIVSEVMDTRQVERAAELVDVLQVGARNMQNFPLLTEIGRTRRPVLLKRGLSARIEELLMAAEYVMAQGNRDVILCERGIRTFEPATRNTLDVAAIPVLKRETHLPVIVDPSHAGGRTDLVAPLSYAAIAAGADGLIIEVHPCPEAALSDGDQALEPAQFAELMTRLEPFARAAGRSLAPAPVKRRTP
jgi:3-deoxy-7-phosphoheptulonate synthase